jgi:hypothetical protein
MNLTRIRGRANQAICALIASHYAILDYRTPWRAKLAAGAVVGGGILAIQMIRFLVPLNALSGVALTVALVWTAVTVLDRLVPAKLMTEFRTRAGSVQVQAHVRAYFECMALLLAAAAAFAIWYVAWP